MNRKSFYWLSFFKKINEIFIQRATEDVHLGKKSSVFIVMDLKINELNITMIYQQTCICFQWVYKL